MFLLQSKIVGGLAHNIMFVFVENRKAKIEILIICMGQNCYLPTLVLTMPLTGYKVIANPSNLDCVLF